MCQSRPEWCTSTFPTYLNNVPGNRSGSAGKHLLPHKTWSSCGITWTVFNCSFLYSRRTGSVNLFQSEQPNKETNSPPAKTSNISQISHFIFSPTTTENLMFPVGSSEGKERSESRSHGNLSHAFPTFWSCSVWKGELSWRSALSKLAPLFFCF